ncbi:MAG: hypothetical protein N2Z70_04380 [Bdellovibrionaceae bacterium]|nr:hypothetical protein [Pseudobdellovibrionaceae bacterium]
MTRGFLFSAFFFSIQALMAPSGYAAVSSSNKAVAPGGWRVQGGHGLPSRPNNQPPKSTRMERQPSQSQPQKGSSAVTALSLDQQKKSLARLKHFYDQGQWNEFQSLYRKLSRYSLNPQLRAEMTYLSGLVNYQLGDYIQSLKDFDQGLRWGQGSGPGYEAKVLFAKAKVYQKLNVEEQSRYFYTKIRKEFPQTLEAARAEVELKHLR